MIEFLPPRDDAFGERDVADFVGLDGEDDTPWGDEPSRSRWLTVLAVVGVTGLLAGGVIAAAPWDDPEATPTPTPTTAAPTTTERPRPTTTVATEPTLPIGMPTTPAGWIPIEGSGFRFSYGSSYGDVDVSFVPETDVVVYGSTADVARTDGRWIAIEANTQDMGLVRIRRGAVATTVGDRRVLVSTASDGVVVLDVDPYGNASASGLTISGFGVELAQLLAVAATVDLAWQGGTRVLDLEAVEAGGALDGLDLVADEEMVAWSAGFVAGTPKAWTNVVDDTGTWWNVELVRPYDRPSRASAMLRWVPIAVDEQPLEIQQRLDELAQLGWQVELRRSVIEPLLAARAPLPDGDELVVSTYGTVDDLLDVVGALRPATDAEWAELLLAAQNGRLDVPMSDVRYESTTLGSGTNWSSEVSRAGDAPWQFGLSTMYSYTYEPFAPGQGSELVEYRSLQEAYLRATVAAPSEARYVIVSQDGEEDDRSRLKEIPGTGVLAAVVRLRPELPYRVTWTDELGNPVDGPVDAAATSTSSGVAP